MTRPATEPAFATQCYENYLFAYNPEPDAWYLAIQTPAHSSADLGVHLGRYDSKEAVDKAMATIYGAIVTAYGNGFDHASPI